MLCDVVYLLESCFWSCRTRAAVCCCCWVCCKPCLGNWKCDRRQDGGQPARPGVDEDRDYEPGSVHNTPPTFSHQGAKPSRRTLIFVYTLMYTWGASEVSNPFKIPLSGWSLHIYWKTRDEGVHSRGGPRCQTSLLSPPSRAGQLGSCHHKPFSLATSKLSDGRICSSTTGLALYGWRQESGEAEQCPPSRTHLELCPPRRCWMKVSQCYYFLRYKAGEQRLAHFLFFLSIDRIKREK